MKLKALELELADDLTLLQVKKGLSKPFMKRWRVWCNGVHLGDIIKNSNNTFKIYPYKCDIGDIYHYTRERVEGKVKYKFNPKGVDPRKWDGIPNIKEAKALFLKTFKANLRHILEE